MTRIGLIGGKPFERDLLREWLGRAPGVRSITGLVEDSRQLPLQLQGIDIVAALVGDDGALFQTLSDIVDDGAPSRAVAVLRSPTEYLIQQAAVAGVSAVVAIASGPDVLGRAIKVVSSGGAWLDPALSLFVLGHLGRGPTATNPHGLTPRELEVARCFRQGLSNREIAAEQGVGEETIKTHVRNIYRKLGVRSRPAAVAALRGAPLPER